MKTAIRVFVLAVAASSLHSVAPQAQDLEKGATVYRQKCFQCHRVGAGARNLMGPQLNGVVGRPSMASEGFNYSPAQKAKRAEGLVWTEEALNAYLESPRTFMPGTRMYFVGLPSEEDRKAVIAYLKTFNEKGEQTAAAK